MTKDNSIYLNHILDAISNIISFTNDLDKEGFVNNKLVQDATIRNLEIIGEAAKNLSPEYRKENPEVDWKGMAFFFYMGVRKGVLFCGYCHKIQRRSNIHLKINRPPYFFGKRILYLASVLPLEITFNLGASRRFFKGEMRSVNRMPFT